MSEDLAKHYIRDPEGLGEDPQREGLLDTPNGQPKPCNTCATWLQQNLDEVVNNALFESSSEEMVIVRDIELYSLEHHAALHRPRPIPSIPTGKVVACRGGTHCGHVCRRLQIRNLTRQIADAVMSVTSAAGVGVVIEAKHMCMMMRGVEKQNSVMTSSSMLGSFRSSVNTRQEFLQLIRGR